MEYILLLLVMAAFIWLPSGNATPRANEKPPPESYRIKYTQTYAATKKALKQALDPPSEWRIRDEDRERGEIRAYFEHRQQIEGENGRTEHVVTGVTCEIAIVPQVDGASDVTLSYRVSCPAPAKREGLDLVIEHTSKHIREALKELETKTWMN